MPIELLLTPESDHHLPLLLNFILLALLPLQGGSLLLANWHPVTPQAVERFRSQERTRLFQQAQGKMLPWQYCRWTRILEGALGLLLLLSTIQGASAAISIASKDGLAWIFLFLGLLLGLLLLIDSVYLNPWRAQRFAARSSTELVNRLSIGELVTSDPSEPER